MSDLEGLFHAGPAFAVFFLLSRARRGTLSGSEWGLRTRPCLFLMERVAERRDGEKRSMFPQQMGIIHAARVSAALRAPSTPRVSMLKMTHNVPFSPNVFNHLDLVEIVSVYLASSVFHFQSNTLQPFLPHLKCVLFNSVQLTMIENVYFTVSCVFPLHRVF